MHHEGSDTNHSEDHESSEHGEMLASQRQNNKPENQDGNKFNSAGSIIVTHFKINNYVDESGTDLKGEEETKAQLYNNKDSLHKVNNRRKIEIDSSKEDNSKIYLNDFELIDESISEFNDAQTHYSKSKRPNTALKR